MVNSPGLPANLPAKQQFSRIAQLLEHVIDEGRSAIQGLRSSRVELADLEQAFVRVQHELALQHTGNDGLGHHARTHDAEGRLPEWTHRGILRTA